MSEVEAEAEGVTESPACLPLGYYLKLDGFAVSFFFE